MDLPNKLYIKHHFECESSMLVGFCISYTVVFSWKWICFFISSLVCRSMLSVSFCQARRTAKKTGTCHQSCKYLSSKEWPARSKKWGKLSANGNYYRINCFSCTSCKVAVFTRTCLPRKDVTTGCPVVKLSWSQLYKTGMDFHILVGGGNISKLVAWLSDSAWVIQPIPAWRYLLILYFQKSHQTCDFTNSKFYVIFYSVHTPKLAIFTTIEILLPYL